MPSRLHSLYDFSVCDFSYDILDIMVRIIGYDIGVHNSCKHRTISCFGIFRYGLPTIAVRCYVSVRLSCTTKRVQPHSASSLPRKEKSSGPIETLC